MKDRPLPSDDDDVEPVRFTGKNPPIEEYLEWCEELNAYIAPGKPSEYDAEAEMRKYQEERKNRTEEERGGLFTVDMLRAAGALDFPPSWRKSLKVERDLFSDAVEEDEEQNEEGE